MKAIVIYYSYSGNTKNIALHIAEALNADTAVIDTVKAYEGITTLLWNRATMKSEKDSGPR